MAGGSNLLRMKRRNASRSKGPGGRRLTIDGTNDRDRGCFHVTALAHLAKGGNKAGCRAVLVALAEGPGACDTSLRIQPGPRPDRHAAPPARLHDDRAIGAAIDP